MINCAAVVQEGDEVNHVFEMLNDLALGQRANAILLEVVGDEGVALAVENQIASLSGLVRSSVVKENCEKAVKQVPGISAVDNRLNVLSKDTSVF
jgi:hypothetical protein